VGYRATKVHFKAIIEMTIEEDTFGPLFKVRGESQRRLGVWTRGHSGRSGCRTEDTQQDQTTSSDQLGHKAPAQRPPPPTPEQRHQPSAPDSTAHSPPPVTVGCGRVGVAGPLLSESLCLVRQIRDTSTGEVFTGTSPTHPWTAMCLAKGSSTRISGPLFFGFSDPITQRAVSLQYTGEEAAAAAAGETVPCAEPSKVQLPRPSPPPVYPPAAPPPGQLPRPSPCAAPSPLTMCSSLSPHHVQLPRPSPCAAPFPLTMCSSLSPHPHQFTHQQHRRQGSSLSPHHVQLPLPSPCAAPSPLTMCSSLSPHQVEMAVRSLCTLEGLDETTAMALATTRVFEPYGYRAIASVEALAKLCRKDRGAMLTEYLTERYARAGQTFCRGVSIQRAKHVRIVTLGFRVDRSRGRFATPAYSPLHDCRSY
jgi:hypothetical protein